MHVEHRSLAARSRRAHQRRAHRPVVVRRLRHFHRFEAFQLRGGTRPESFVGRWVQKLLFYRAPEWVFTALYCAWAAATLLTLKLVPPKTR